MGLLTIGQLAKETNHTVVSIRYYEKRGLIVPSLRSEGGYRLYPNEAISRLQFIKNAKHVGFTLEEIEHLFMLQTSNAPSQSVKLQTQKKIEEIDRRIAALKEMREVLAKWECACDGKMPIDECPILGKLYKTEVK